MKVFLTIVAIFALFMFGVYMKVSVWNECRVDHSFWYCWTLISK